MEASQHPPKQSANQQIARSASKVMIALVFGQIIGLLASSLTGSTFGATMENDAFYAANRFPDILFNLIAGGALASAFIPTFTTLLATEKREKAWKLASSIVNLLLLLLTCVAILSEIFAPQLVRYVIAPGFKDSPEAMQLTIQLLRIQLPSAIIFGVSGLLMGILNTHQHFLLPALAPSMYKIGWIFGIIVLCPSMGIQGLSWGVVIGAGLHLLIQLPSFFKLPQWKYEPILGLQDATVREVGRLMAPRLLGVAAVQLNFALNTYLASMQPEGSISGITWGFSLMLMPQIAIAQSVAIVSLPMFSRQAALGKLNDMRSSLVSTLRSVLFLAVPASIGLILLRDPLVAAIFQRNEFTSQSTAMVSWALFWYSTGLIGHCVVEIVSRAFYALHDTKTPVSISILAMSLNYGFSLLFSYLFSQWGWLPHGGLALANSLATFLEMLILLWFMRKHLSGLNIQGLLKGVGVAGLASIPMIGAILIWQQFSANLSVFIQAGVGVIIGGGIYMAFILLFRPPEILSLINMIKQRILRQST
ncbi:MAG: murein biosynthesis integral membrane protein MurJ [Anaerolineaceae bacterium]|nr:murein biosynthesis integral membrane protein MurJ [Anaerolineaceae bacterium]